MQGFAGDLGTAAAANEIARVHPGVEILINNLGIFEPKAFEDIPDADWMRFFEVNVLGGVRLARPNCRPCGVRTGGASSLSRARVVVQIPAEMIHYGVTKTAQLACIARPR